MQTSGNPGKREATVLIRTQEIDYQAEVVVVVVIQGKSDGGTPSATRAEGTYILCSAADCRSTRCAVDDQ
jgi:hypothetical protein